MAINTTSKKLLTTRAVTTSISGSGTTAPTISLVRIADSNYNILDDTALGTTGGYLIITGTGFKSGCTAYINNTSVTTSFISATEVRATAPSILSGTYSVILFNPDKAGAIYLSLTTSPFPNFTTSAGSLGTVYETGAVSVPVVATSDSTVTYAITSGSLPPGVTLNPTTGVLSGTSQLTGSNTTYSFVIDATDGQNQNSSRSFSLTINTDVVTWSSPADGTTVTLTQYTAANQALAATSAAGQPITYTANQLPAGLSISGSNVIGTPSTSGSSSTLFTATAAITNKSATRTINWTINPGIDTYFPNVSLLLQTSSTNTQQNNTFLDSSSNNFTITRTGTPTQGSFTPYRTEGYWSYYSAGSDYVSTSATSTNLRLDQGNWTMEFWLYITAWNTNNRIFDTGANGDGAVMCIGYSNAGLLSFGTPTAGTGVVTPTGTLTLNRWYHIALTSDGAGSNGRIYVDGVLKGGPTNYTNPSGTTAIFNLGKNNVVAGDWSGLQGYMSNFRFVSGQRLYTANFTPQITPLNRLTYSINGGTTFSTITGTTQLLTLQNNRFKDNSNNAFTLISTGTPKTQAFQPFNLPATYIPASYGGSGYFNGSSDYLTIAAPNGGALDISGGSNFTIEAWFYATSTASMTLWTRGGTNGSQNAQYWANLNNGSMQWGFGNGGTGAALNNVTGIQNNCWNHFAVTLVGTTFTAYLNGVAANTATLTFTIPTTINNPSLWIGGQADPGARLWWSGYITGFRLIKGTALYTGNFTPPRQTITGNITNLLLNSEDPANANYFWSNYQTTVTVTANAAVAPDGTTTAVLMTPAASNNQHTWRNAFGPTVGNTYTYSVYYKSAGGQYAHLFIGGGNPGAIFDLINGTVNNQNGLTTSSITNAGNGWWRCSITQTAQAGNGNVYYGVGTVNNNFITTTTGSESIYFWGPQVELAATVGTYYPTPSNSPVAPSFVLNSGNSGIYDVSGQNNLITVGSVQASTTQAKWSPTSMKFNGTSDYVSMPLALSPNLALGSGNWTLECWIYPTTVAVGQNIIMDWRTSNNAQPNLYLLNAAVTLRNNNTQIFSSGTISANTWTHLAVVKNGSTTTLYINGTSITSAGDTTTYNSDATVQVGKAWDANYWNGYIQDLRITRGFARYTANFTPPTSAFLAR